MPGHKTHLLIGYVIHLIVSIIIYQFYKFSPVYFVMATLLTFLYAQLPDLDSHTSKIRKYYQYVIFIIMGLGYLFTFFYDPVKILISFSILGTMSLIIHITGHRSKTFGLHNFIFLFLTTLPLVFIHWYLAADLFLVMLSHLIADRILTN